MKLKLVGKSCRTQCLALAAALLSVLLYCTPALNLTYRYIDSKGFIHIENFSLPESPAQEARQSLFPVNKSETAASAVQSTPGSTADSSGSINRVVDREGIIRITSAAESAPPGCKASRAARNFVGFRSCGADARHPCSPAGGSGSELNICLDCQKCGRRDKNFPAGFSQSTAKGYDGSRRYRSGRFRDHGSLYASRAILPDLFCPGRFKKRYRPHGSLRRSTGKNVLLSSPGSGRGRFFLECPHYFVGKNRRPGFRPKLGSTAQSCHCLSLRAGRTGICASQDKFFGTKPTGDGPIPGNARGKNPHLPRWPGIHAYYEQYCE